MKKIKHNGMVLTVVRKENLTGILVEQINFIQKLILFFTVFRIVRKFEFIINDKMEVVDILFHFKDRKGNNYFQKAEDNQKEKIMIASLHIEELKVISLTEMYREEKEKAGKFESDYNNLIQEYLKKGIEQKNIIEDLKNKIWSLEVDLMMYNSSIENTEHIVRLRTNAISEKNTQIVSLTSNNKKLVNEISELKKELLKTKYSIGGIKSGYIKKLKLLETKRQELSIDNLVNQLDKGIMDVTEKENKDIKDRNIELEKALIESNEIIFNLRLHEETH